MKRYLTLPVFLFVLLACKESRKQLPAQAGKTMPPVDLPDTLISTIDLAVVRNGDVIDTFHRFSSKMAHPYYKVEEQFNGKIPPIDFSTSIHGKTYQTRIRDAVKTGPNFAGHYTFAYWGCGSNCGLSAIVDLETGKVYDGPEASSGYRFSVSSKIILVNPPDSSQWFQANTIYGPPKEFIWNKNVCKPLVQ